MFNFLSRFRRSEPTHPLPVSVEPFLQAFEPETEVRVPGFAIEVVRKSGCIYKTRPKDSPEDTPYTNKGVDEYFEVTVSHDGSNNLFQEAKGPWTFKLTNTLEKGGPSGMLGQMHYQSLGETFTNIEVVEEYEDHHNNEFFSRRCADPEMVVWVKIHVLQSNGLKSSCGCGIVSRPAG